LKVDIIVIIIIREVAIGPSFYLPIFFFLSIFCFNLVYN